LALVVLLTSCSPGVGADGGSSGGSAGGGASSGGTATSGGGATAVGTATAGGATAGGTAGGTATAGGASSGGTATSGGTTAGGATAGGSTTAGGATPGGATAGGSTSATYDPPGARAGYVHNWPTSADGTIGFDTATGAFTGTVVNTTLPAGLPSTWGLDVQHLTDTGNPSTNYSNLIAALARNKIVTLPSNATYDVSAPAGFIFPSLGPGSTWAYLMSRAQFDGPAQLLPGVRANQALHAADMATLRMVNTGNLSATFRLEQGTTTASYYRFIGVRFTAADTSTNPVDGDLFRLSYNDAVRNHHIQFHRCIVTTNTAGTRRSRNIIANGTDFFAFIDGEMSGAFNEDTAYETHAFVQFQGGPIKIVNNTILDGQIGVLLGGADPGDPNTGLHDFEFRRNFVYLPQTAVSVNAIAWKNRMEIKFCDRWLVTGNVFDGSWGGAQEGTLVHFTLSVSPASAANPLIQTRDGVFWYNEGRRGNRAIQLTGFTSGMGVTATKRQTRLSISNNIFHRMREGNAAGFGPARNIQIVGDLRDLEMYKNIFDYVAHSRGAAGYEAINGSAVAATNVWFKDNIFERPAFGWKWSTEGIVTFDAQTGGSKVWTNQVFYGGGTESLYNNGTTYINWIVPNRSSIGYSSTTAPTTLSSFEIVSGDYRAGGARDASDGSQMGATPSRVISATAGVGF
jgi:hypothetical protein